MSYHLEFSKLKELFFFFLGQEDLMEERVAAHLLESFQRTLHLRWARAA